MVGTHADAHDDVLQEESTPGMNPRKGLELKGSGSWRPKIIHHALRQVWCSSEVWIGSGPGGLSGVPSHPTIISDRNDTAPDVVRVVARSCATHAKNAGEPVHLKNLCAGWFHICRIAPD